MLLQSSDDESARLEALQSCHILDTPPEELLDHTARLAAYLCGTPIALIGLIDASRVWFKARVGWNYAQIPREDSFCQHTIHGPDLLVITDASADDRFRDGPIVTHAGIRFYAGAPLLTKEGYALGTLCVMDCLPRELPDGHNAALLTLAQLVCSQLEIRRSTAATSAVSEHKRTENALRHSEDRLLGIISSAMDAIITVDHNQRIVVFNKAAEQIFRCPTAQVLGQPLDRFIPQKLREAHRQHIRTFGNTGTSSRSMCSPGTLMGVRADGEEFPVEATISQVKTASENLYTVILRDITVRKRTEDEWRQAQKMEAVGHLAGGIAHEFNNYLAIIMGYSDLLAQNESQNESVRLTVTEINTATQRAASLTRQLLAGSRKQMLEPSVLDFNKSIREMHKLLRRIIPANIEIIPVLQPELGQVRADPVQIQQILMNLAVNARDAMPQGGKISIETAEVAGLGLSTTYGIVKQSGGHITVASVRGSGTTFRVYLPKLLSDNSDIAVSPSEPADQHRQPTREGVHHTQEMILLVEDESALRRLMRSTLEREGHKVLEAKDGAEALSICQKNPSIALIVSDLAMPQMTGLELREKLAALRPNIKFLLISGYAKDVVVSPEQIAKFADFLEKPFRPDELMRKVRELLGRINGKEEQSRGGNTLPGLPLDKSDAGKEPPLNKRNRGSLSERSQRSHRKTVPI